MTLTPKMRPFGLALLVAAMPGVAEAEPTPPVTELPPEGGHSPAERFASVITVSQVGCPDLNVERIRQQLRLELSTLIPVVTELPQLAVEFACTDERVRVTLADSVTVKVVARDVSLGASADNERTLALAASELFLASWAELLIERPNTPKRQLDTVATAAKKAVERVVSPQPSHSPGASVDLFALARERNLSDPLLTLGGLVRIGQSSGSSVQLFIDLGFEHGQADRPLGRVEVIAGSAGVGLRGRVRAGLGELGLSGSISATYISLEGVPSGPGYYGARNDGVAAECTFGFDASLNLRPITLGVTLLAGGLYPSPIGRVEGGSPIIGGASVGAGVFMGLSL